MKHFWVTDGKSVSHCVFGRPKIMFCVEEDKQKPVTVVSSKFSKCLVSDDKKTAWFSSDQSTFHFDDFSSQFSFEEVAAAAKVELVETAEINHCAIGIVGKKYNCAVSEDGTKFWFKDCGIWRLDHKWKDTLSVTKCSFSDDRKAKKRIVQCLASDHGQ